MFPSTLFMRVIGLREEEDYAFTDQWIEQEAKTRLGSITGINKQPKIGEEISYVKITL